MADRSNMSYEQKKLAVAERLQKRQEARQVEIDKKRIENEENISRQENVIAFLDNFSQAKQAIEEGISQSQLIPKENLVGHFDSLSDSLHKMQRYVAECTAFLPSFEVRKAQESISCLQGMIQDKRDELLPKRKFAFSKASKPEKRIQQVSSSKPAISDEVDTAVELAACKFVKETGKQLIMGSSDIYQKDVALVDLTDCTVKLHGAPSAVHIFNLADCKIFCGPVSGSIFIRSCRNCLFVLACQQLRIHNTTDSDFYIHVTSKAIIEDCSNIKFAPYTWNYETLEEDYIMSGLDKTRNNWDKVDDFNWLVADVASPNWSVLEESKRTLTWLC